MASNHGPRGRRNPGLAPGEKLQKGIFRRIIKDVFSFYPVMLPVVIACIMISSLISSIPSVFQQKVIAVIESSYKSGDWSGVKGEIFRLVTILITLYVISLSATIAFNQMMATVTQGTLKKMREKLFERMETLPVRFFDRRQVGDTMSLYTNDIDALRQMVSQSFPQMLNTFIMIITVICIMLYYSVYMTLVVLAGVMCMFVITKFVGGGSAKFFFKQQQAIGKAEGYIQETISGAKVVKVFCHERECRDEFEVLNNDLFTVASRANKYANILAPILNNMGNILYVVVGIAGGFFISAGVRNIGIGGLPFSISLVIPFLGMTRMFCGQIGQISMQINAVVAGLAGCERIYRVMDESSEEDEGYVHLVNVREENGGLVETDEKTNSWAWKHPHKADGTVTYTPLRGDIVLDGVDFSYEKDKQVLYDISLYAKPGQKVAFVGATGAGNDNKPSEQVL